LLLGDWERGWADFVWWRQRSEVRARQFDRPLWDGSALNGKPILLHEELGLGDVIQFVRYAPLVRARGGHVIVECDRHLVPLVRTCAGVDEVIERDSGALFDLHAPLMDLPAIFHTTQQTVPARIPYLSPEPQLTEQWRQRLSDAEGIRVGICWQGDRKHPRDRQRSIPLKEFAPLARVPGVHLISLQRVFGEEQIPSADFPLRHDCPDLANIAAIMANLDLVVTIDSAVAHLAGALATPVWVLLAPLCDWRWMLKRSDTPWYTTMRLVRSVKPEDWTDAMARIADELRVLVGQLGM
jgi:hypothetical protein